MFAVISLLVFGTLGYVVVEGWSWFEALYMTAITVTTVGFNEVRPLSDAGRAFSIVLIFIGVGVATGVLSSLARRIIERQVNWVLGKKDE
ncbi:MAG: potassium channel family protein [Bdellovibrionota bacterium]